MAAYYVGTTPFLALTGRKRYILFDLESVELAGPPIDWSMFFCPHCNKVQSENSCAEHADASLTSFLDRRPLLLSDELREAVQQRSHELVNRLGDMEDEERDFVLTDLIPFLAVLAEESSQAKLRKDSTGSGYRTTYVSVSEAMTLIEKLCVPPTQVEK